MLISKLKKDIELLKKQLNEIETNISDPIERIEQRKLLERKIKKLEQSKSQIETLEQEQQELNLLKSEFFINDTKLVNNKELEITDSINNCSNIIKSETNFAEPVENTKESKQNQLNLKESNLPLSSSGSLKKFSTSWFKIKYLAIFCVIFSIVVATLLIINFNSTQKVEQAILQELTRQQIIKAKEEAEQARQAQAKAERETQEAQQQVEQARQETIQVKKEVQEQLEASNSNLNNSTPKYLFLSERKVTQADLINKIPWELDIMRNEIYARHGRKFNTVDLQQYFNEQTWYYPIYSPEQFDNNLLSLLEKDNATFILEYQEQHNLQYF